MLARDLDSSGRLRWPVNPIATVDGSTIACADFTVEEFALATCVEPDMPRLLRTQLQNLLRREVLDIDCNQISELRKYAEIVTVPG